MTLNVPNLKETIHCATELNCDDVVVVHESSSENVKEPDASTLIETNPDIKKVGPIQSYRLNESIHLVNDDHQTLKYQL